MWRQVKAAQRTAEQTRIAIDGVLTFGSGNRATTLIQAIKTALQKGQWEVGYHQCQTLRGLIGDLRTSSLSPQHAESVDEAVSSLTAIENDLNAAIRKKQTPERADGFNESLSIIQNTLENILSENIRGKGR